ncbi:MAG: hypothetical protein HQ464_09775 [Planctomycetes bacterium]|nr:hypothetical protein [Planctomycetota bacterium]
MQRFRRGTQKADPAGPEPVSRWLRNHGPIVAALVVQAVVAAFLCFLRFGNAPAVLQEAKKYPFVHLLAAVDWAGAAWGLAVLALAFLLPPQRWVDDLAAWLGRHVCRVAVGVAVAFAILSFTVHHAYAFTMDEYAPLFQSQVFARGRLVAQWPPGLAPLLVSPENIGWFLEMSPVTGQACSSYWPGQAILMTPFTFLGIPWACNPAFSGCAVLLLAAVARHAFGDRAAGWAVLFALASPVFAAYGISFYSMTAHLTLNLLYAWLLLGPTLPRVAGAGLVGGFALALHNPFPHFVFALPWLGWLATRSDRWSRLPVIGLCYAATFLPLDIGWRHVEESIRGNRPATVFAAATEAAVTAKQPADDAAAQSAPQPPPAVATGVAALLGNLRGYFTVLELPGFVDLLKGRVAALLRLIAWDSPGLVVLACWGFWRSRRATPARLFALSGLTTFLAYGLVVMSGGHGWGYRYFFSTWSCLPLLAAALAAADVADDEGGREQSKAASCSSADVLRVAGLAAVLSLAICLPVRLWQIHAYIADHLTQMPPRPAAAGFGSGDFVSFLDPGQGLFRNDLIRNHPFVARGPYVFVSHGPDADKAVIEQLAKNVGLKSQFIAADARGSTWVLQPNPTENPAP